MIRAYLTREAKEILTHYQPLLTEFSGLKDVGNGTILLAFILFCRGVDSNPRKPFPGEITATQAIQGAGLTIAQGLIKLSIPLSVSTAYLAYKKLSQI